ncbi:M48 family metallopeptidase [Sphaerospermopsis aphanizomenoides BCCUSP55]|uniref:M48 family metallopeptidase n=1 Tax=Sphaerospermopsis aphanizomenoides TaxID=459663 RepID=UPI00190621A5|nr:M48 family metallopeptidase [Sphaerospermopsis aphanizomenoides]MBK1990337.1 M48 family metallopeptidase [Sphaerospermopsis aphanizomenoides BCCUSP55]
MALTQEQFDTLITQLESYAQEQPSGYKLKVGLLAVLGYAYIFMILAVLLSLFLGFVWLIFYIKTLNSVIIKLGLVMLVPIFVVLRSLWVSFPEPEGLKLKRQDAPNLFNMINELTDKLKAPRFNYILLTDEFNAAVFQRPRFGLLGWQENYLLLGFPLMQGLSPNQFGAVIAHELGHLSANHSRFAGWIYRIQKTYYQILERLQNTGDAFAISCFQPFFNWYAPFFSAYSFVLRRMNEYEADKCAAQLLGAKNTGEALINVDVKAKLLYNSFWPSVYKQAQELIEPPNQVYTEMSATLLNSDNANDSLRFLQQSLAEKTDYQDTHPCLVDRLKAIGYLNNNQELNLPPQFQISAAREYLGNSLPQFTNYFEQAWCEKMQTPWRQRYAYAQESLEKLSKLEARAKIQSLDVEETWQLAYWTYEFRSEDAAIPILQEILQKDANRHLRKLSKPLCD